MFLVGIAGGSGSGKTTFAKKVMEKVNHAEVALMHQDSYYLASPPSHIHKHGAPNFDHPGAFDWPLLHDHLSRLKAGEQISSPIYDYRVSQRTTEVEKVGPCKTIIWKDCTRSGKHRSATFSISKSTWTSKPTSVSFAGCIVMFVNVGGQLDSIIRQYYDSVRPMHR